MLLDSWILHWILWSKKLSHTTSQKPVRVAPDRHTRTMSNPTNTLSHVSLRWGLSWANRNHQCHIYSYLWGQNLSNLDSGSCFNVSAVHWFRVGVIIVCPFHHDYEVTTRNLQWIDENNCNLHSFDVEPENFTMSNFEQIPPTIPITDLYLTKDSCRMLSTLIPKAARFQVGYIIHNPSILPNHQIQLTKIQNPWTPAQSPAFCSAPGISESGLLSPVAVSSSASVNLRF